MWITNGAIADVAIVWARTEDGHQRVPGQQGMPGFTAPDDEEEAVAARVGDVRADPGTCGCQENRCSRGVDGCAARCPAWARRASASSGAPSARRAHASRRRSTTPRTRILREADRGVPAHSEKLAEMAGRAQPGNAPRAPPRADEGQGDAAARAREPREDGQRAGRARGRGAPARSSAATGSRSSTR